MTSAQTGGAPVPTGRRRRPAWWLTWPWWIWTVITCSILTAHLVAAGDTFAWWALIVVLVLLHLAWYWPAHSRLSAWLYGACIAFYTLVLVEIYLGTTGLYFGPIGSEERGILYGDTIIVESCLWFYRRAEEYRSWGSLIAGSIIYGVVGFFASRARVSWLADLVAIPLMVAAILLSFRFTHPFEMKQVAMKQAMFEASAAILSLGSYEAAVKELAQETAKLGHLAAQLRDPTLVDKKKKLSDVIREYAILLAKLDDRDRIKVKILRQPLDNYRAQQFLPHVPQHYPSGREATFVLQGPDPHAANVTTDDILHSYALTRRAQQLIAEGNRLQEKGKESFEIIEIYVSNEVIYDLGSLDRSDVIKVASQNILQTIVTHDLDDAIDDMQDQITDLRRQLDQQDEENARLERSIEDFKLNLAAAKRRESDCAVVLRDLSRLLESDYRLLLTSIGERYETAQGLLARFRPAVSTPESPNGVNETAIQQEVLEQLAKENVYPPQFTRTDLETVLHRVAEGSASVVSEFADAMCKAGNTANDIVLALQNVGGQLNQLR